MGRPHIEQNLKTHFGRFSVCVLIALAGCGCAAGGAALLRAHVSGDRDHVVVTGERDAGTALALAVAHCSSYGRSARAVRSAGEESVYDCVVAR